MTDQLTKYLFTDRSTRVQTVSLQEAWQTGLHHQPYPEPVQKLLGELTAAAVLLAGNLKFDGTLVLQIQGDGPIALLVVECTSELTIRATATLHEDTEIPQDATLQQLLNQQGEGRFIVVLDPANKDAGMQPYQGVVPLEGDSIAQNLESYMRHSEQLDTRIWLQASAEQAAGLLLQKLPGIGGTELEASAAETWERAGHLADTLEERELLEASPETIVHRLFWDDALLRLESQAITWFCPCTRERVQAMLAMLGQEEIAEILAEQPTIEVACNFCGKPYVFDPVDCASLFVADSSHVQAGDDTLH